MRKTWIVIGIAAVASVISAIVCINKRKNIENQDISNCEKSETHNNSINSSEEIKARHEDAAEIIREATENIIANVQYDQDDQERMEQVSKELDDLLSED
ncbi:hypothetical protein O3651_07125 [Streptococcus sp. 27098_8_73]|uniref:hypothetical protein n=1 Tax=Streptococcus TaxID=1301 RepID=UPI002001BBC5|nr:hypothetical protein [Streptococcus cristatus]